MMSEPHNIGSGLLVRYDSHKRYIYIYIDTVDQHNHFVMNMNTFNKLLKYIEEELDKEDKDDI